MFTLYNLLKFLHIVAVIIWIGGVIALAVVNARIAREEDGTAIGLLSRQSQFFGRAVIGPAAIVTLVAGIAMVVVLDRGLALWIAWGLAGVFGSLALGAVFLRRTNRELAQLSTTAAPDRARLLTVRRRLALLGALNIALLLSTVWAMVFKPTLG